MEETKFRYKIIWLNFLCSLLVIWMHAGNAELFLNAVSPGHPLIRMEYVIIPTIIRISIPCFIIISAYLFYRGFTWDKLLGKWKRRARTLLIPYLFWNLLYYLGYLIASRIEYLDDIVNKPGLKLTLANVFDAVFRYAFNPVFWFMYQLILLVLLAPALYLLLKSFWTGLGLLAVIILGLCGKKNLPELNLDALFYYAAGAFSALHLRKAVEAPWTKKRAALGFVLLAGSFAVNFGIFKMQSIAATVLCQTAAAAGLWLMADENRPGTVKPWMTCTFFIYAFHFIPVRLINKVSAMLLPGNVWAAVLLFLCMPVMATAICYQAARLLRRFTPRLWRLMNGGR